MAKRITDKYGKTHTVKGITQTASGRTLIMGTAKHRNGNRNITTFTDPRDVQSTNQPLDGGPNEDDGQGGKS